MRRLARRASAEVNPYNSCSSFSAISNEISGSRMNSRAVPADSGCAEVVLAERNKTVSGRLPDGRGIASATGLTSEASVGTALSVRSICSLSRYPSELRITPRAFSASPSRAFRICSAVRLASRSLPLISVTPNPILSRSNTSNPAISK